MKVNRILTLGLLVAFAHPQKAGANLSMTPEVLGSFESAIDYCAKLDPKSAAKYKEWGTAYVGDATKEELQKARTSSEYKKAYDATTHDAEKTPKAKVLKACTDLLGKKLSYPI
jgi:hypothetical protein